MSAPIPGTAITPSLKLVRPLGSGGMGSVWVAEHLGLRTHVVVKFIAEELAANPEAVARFSREAAAASLVKSPHVVHMIDYGVLPNGTAFIAMELLEGHDLRHRLDAERVMPPKQLATILSQVAKALMRAHERGVVHRDIKPDNIFLSDGGGGEAFIKVLDFGVAKVEDTAQMSRTKTGASIGTPYYMSPEQVLGSKTLDHRTDLWSLGVVALEAVTGRRPFDGDTIGALSLAICSQPLPVPSSIDPALPRALDAWFARACARSLEARFSTAKELADAFESAVGGHEPVRFDSSSAARLAHAPTQSPASVSGAAGNQAAGSAPESRATSTLGAVSETSPGTAPSTRRRTLAVGSAIGFAVLVGGAALALRARDAGTKLPSASTREVPAVAAPASAGVTTSESSVSPVERTPPSSGPSASAPTLSPDVASQRAVGTSKAGAALAGLPRARPVSSVVRPEASSKRVCHMTTWIDDSGETHAKEVCE